MAFTPIMVTRTYYDADLSAAAGLVRFMPTSPMINAGTVVASTVTATVDPQGQIAVLLAANNDPATTPGTPFASYRVVEEIAGQSRREYFVQIPHDAAGGTIDLGGLNSLSAPPVVTYPAPGPQGAPGADSTVPGPAGAAGTNGTNGTNGVGVPVGGTTGQYLRKSSATDYATAWQDSSDIPAALVDAKGDVLAGTADNTVARVAVGGNGQVLAAASGATPGIAWTPNPTPAVVVLADTATPALDAAAGKVFDLTATGNRTIAVPTNAVDGRAIVIRHRGSGGARTLALNTTGAGSFDFSTDIPALTATASGAVDVIACVYDGTAQRWLVVGVTKGF